MNKKYIMFNDGRLGYIKNVCTCDKCKERGMAEIFINDLDDKYMDCIKSNEVSDMIYIGESLRCAINSLIKYYETKINRQKKENECLQSIIDFYATYGLFEKEI